VLYHAEVASSGTEWLGLLDRRVRVFDRGVGLLARRIRFAWVRAVAGTRVLGAITGSGIPGRAWLWAGPGWGSSARCPAAGDGQRRRGWLLALGARCRVAARRRGNQRRVARVKPVSRDRRSTGTLNLAVGGVSYAAQPSLTPRI